MALLPDALFFTRSLPVSPEAAGAESAAEIGAQVELALESVAPFPLSQLYYGYYWAPGSDRALAFASYRRRFTAEQTADWAGAEVVLPIFAALLGAPVAPATTLVLSSPDGMTAIHWGSGPVPSRVVFLPIPPETTEEERPKLREALLRPFESKAIVDLAEPPVAEGADRDGAVQFRAGEILSRFEPPAAAALDVRDKDELAARRRSRRRDVLLWRAGVACVAGFGLLLLGELALFAGGLWQKERRAQFTAQSPMVERISAADDMAHKIEDLRDKRLLPLEMLTLVQLQRPSADVQFLRVQTSLPDRYSISLQAQTPNPAEIDVFQSKLKAQPFCDSVTVKNNNSNDKNTVFTLTVTFKPGTVQPMSLPSSS